MKNSILYFVLLLFAVSCNNNSSSHDTIKNFIPGTYVCPFKEIIDEDTYVAGTDTLRIKNQTTSGSETYEIDRSKNFTRTEDGKAQPEKQETSTWTGSYQGEDKTIYIKNTGGTLAFDVKKRLLKIGKQEYKKIE